MKRILLTALFVLIGVLAFAQERIAIFPFEDRNNVYTKDELDSFYVEFSNEFRNKTDVRRFTVLTRNDLEKLINMESKFQLSDYSSKEKTAEMQRVLNAKQILYGLIVKVGNNIRITVSWYTFPDLNVLPGGATISITNKNQLFDKISELVQSMQKAMAGGGSIPDGNRPSISGQAAVVPNGMVRIEGGTFIMGSPTNETGRGDDEIQHRVTVNSFYMGKYLVTQKEYLAIMGVNPGAGNAEYEGDNFPVMRLDWYDAIEYCNRLSLFEGLTPAYMIDKNRSDPNNKNEHDKKRWRVIWDRDANGYRLPTEAEWEYACRAGTTTPYSFGINITGSLANYHWSDSVHNHDPTPVGKYPPNQWGLYDMHGNVWEWCWDWYGDYSKEAKDNPSGPVSGTFHVLRGGSWRTTKDGIRSAFRLNEPPWYIYQNYGYFDTEGFRVVRN